jgi:hypothetical protein
MFISCTIDEKYRREYNLELEKHKSNFQVCVENCPDISFWNVAKNQECVDKCISKIIDIGESKTKTTVASQPSINSD